MDAEADERILEETAEEVFEGEIVDATNVLSIIALLGLVPTIEKPIARGSRGSKVVVEACSAKFVLALRILDVVGHTEPQALFIHRQIVAGELHGGTERNPRRRRSSCGFGLARSQTSPFAGHGRRHCRLRVPEQVRLRRFHASGWQWYRRRDVTLRGSRPD